MKFKHILIILFTITLFSCKQEYVPKPHGYLRITFPEKKYKIFDSAGFPYKFVYPEYSRISIDTGRMAQPYWINVEFPGYKAKLHISYHDVKKNMVEMLEDVHTLAYKHTVRADAINEFRIDRNDKKVFGLIYDIKGNAASSVQFFVTDSTRHFMRGALYFNVTPNIDSLQPAVNFFKSDIDTLIRSLEWNK